MSVREETLKKQIETYLTNRLGGEAEVGKMFLLSGGACQENYWIDLEIQSGPEKGGYELVFRTDKGATIGQSLTKAEEYGISEMAYKAGVKTPKPYWLETGSEATGSPFYFMERIGGKANGRYIVKDSSLNGVRKELPKLLATNLAKIHSVHPDNAEDEKLKQRLFLHSGSSEKTLAFDSVQVLRKELDQREERYPAMELILNWLEKKAPETDELVLVHGDFRTGNFMVSPEKGLEGIMDWEFAHWGDRHEDLTWLCLRDWRFGKQNKEAGGFADRDEFFSEYEKASGKKVDLQKILYWEVMGNLRWAIGCLQQAERHLSGADKGIELASIGRRACEMEYEAMRLIENAG